MKASSLLIITKHHHSLTSQFDNGSVGLLSVQNDVFGYSYLTLIRSSLLHYHHKHIVSSVCSSKMLPIF